mmetsp:Transcript_56740/g.88312  ORF Transcript_56740/g.88312 Transcript_56740/m.88312 type:complete len:463 (+) Transcript_56740:52-1440(+)
MAVFFIWLASLHVVCIKFCYSSAPDESQKDIAAPFEDGCFAYAHCGLSLLQTAAHLRNGITGAEKIIYRTPNQESQVQISCGSASALQQTSETAIQIPQTLRDNYNLLQVQAVIRHGAPVEVKDAQCPNLSGVHWNCSVLPPQVEAFISGFNENPGDCQFGQLLDWGYEQQVTNGKALRAAYIGLGLLGTCPRVYSYSDDGSKLSYVRTAQSKVALLSAMFEGHSYAHIDQSSDYSIYYTDLNDGAPWALKADSRGTLGDVFEYSRSDAGRDMQDMCIALDCVEEGVCNDVGTPVVVETLQATLTAAVDAASKYYKKSWMNGSLTQASFESAEFIVNILHKLDSIGNMHAPQFVLWSSHDTALFSLALTIGLEMDMWPPYAAVFLLELWRDAATKVDFARILYQGEDVTLKVPVCAAAASAEGLCPLSVLRNHLEVQVDKVRSCGLSLRTPTPLDFSGKECG